MSDFNLVTGESDIYTGFTQDSPRPINSQIGHCD